VDKKEITGLGFKIADTGAVRIIAGLADKIWRKHYRTIISEDQIAYMLEKMYSAESLLEQINTGQEFTLVYRNDIPLGYISVSKKDGGHYFIHKFYIDTDEQSKGIGTAVMNYISAYYKDAGSFGLTVNRKNFTAINFYFKNGFRIKSVEDFDIGCGYLMEDFVMEKNADK
jgi:ribosomal protein S18 acetylase RimI-like enzyme